MTVPPEVEPPQDDPEPDVSGRLSAVVDRIVSGMALLSGFVIFLLMLLAVADIAMREFTGSGVAGALDITTVAMVAAVFVGLAEAERNGTHVRTPVLVSRLSPRIANWGRLVVHSVLVLVLLGTVNATAWRAWEAMQRGEVTPGAARTVVWPTRWLITLGLVALTIEVCRRAWHAYQHIGRPELRPEEDERSQWSHLDGGI